MPDNEDIEVANAVAAEAPIDDEFPDEDGIIDDQPEEEAAEAPPPPPPAITHAPELIERAAVLQIPADEVAAMSPEELRRVIKHADRVGQMVYEAASKKPDAPAPTPVAPPADEFAFLDDPEKYEQGFVQPIKAVLVKQSADNKALRERLEKLESKTGQSEAQVLHSRLMTVVAELAPEAAKAFDLSTKSGAVKYQELLTLMGAVHRSNKGLTEKQIFQRAVRAMDVVPEQPKKAPEVAEREQAWNKGALAQGMTRKTKETAEDRVGRLLQSIKKPKPVNGSK